MDVVGIFRIDKAGCINEANRPKLTTLFEKKKKDFFFPIQV